MAKKSTDSTKTTSNLVPLLELEKLCPTIRVMGHPLRLKMIDFLLVSGKPQRVSEIVAATETARQVIVSQQLAIMHEAGVLTREKKRRCVYYSLTSTFTANMMECVYQAAAVRESEPAKD